MVLVDMSDKWTRNKLDYEVLKCLALNPDVPAILILNKVLTVSLCIDLSWSDHRISLRRKFSFSAYPISHLTKKGGWFAATVNIEIKITIQLSE